MLHVQEQCKRGPTHILDATESDDSCPERLDLRLDLQSTRAELEQFPRFQPSI
jgi:hypothetical protein